MAEGDYSREAGSLFPSAKIKSAMNTKWGFDTFKDLDYDVFSIVGTYYSLLANGNYNAAAAIRDANMNTLRPYWIDAGKLNLFGEEIGNIELYIEKKREHTISPIEPGNITINFYWIKSNNNVGPAPNYS